MLYDSNVIELDNTEAQEEQRLMRIASKWLKRIDQEKDDHEDWRDDAQDTWDVVLDDADDRTIYYPLMWSIAQIEHSAVYSATPIPDVRARNTDRNPNFRDAALVMQRSLEFYLDNTEFDENIDRTVDDFLIAGAGIPRVKLDATIVDTETPDPMTGEMVTEPVITDQVVRVEHVPWDRFGWEPCTNWDHCNWIYFQHELTKKEIKARWGDDVTLSVNEENERRKRDKKHKNRYTVYEVWDKINEEVLIIAEGNAMPLDVSPDPLGLTGFWPVPRPPMLNVAPDDLVPTTDYTYIEPFDLELNRLYKRSKAITEQIKAASLHDSSLVEIEDWRSISDGDSVPVENLNDRLEGGRIDNVMYFWPLTERIETLVQINQQIQLKRAHVDDLMGISDILRGSSNPQDGQETQKIKERWAGVRLKRKQKAIQLMIRDLFRMMAEITVEHVTHDNLERMTQIQISPEVYALLRNDLMREFAINVESDSTVQRDEMAERRERTDVLNALTQYIQIVAPAMNQNQISADLGSEILKIAVDPYKKYSRDMDDVINQLPDTQQQLQKAQQTQAQMQQQLQQMQQQIQEQEYALAQYSQAEEQRKDMDTQGKYAKDMSTANKNQAGIPDEQAQAGNTLADTWLKEKQADKTEVESIQIARQPL